MAARGYIFVLLAAIMWGSLGPVARYAFSQGIEPLEVAFWRCIIPFIPFCFQALRQGNARIAPADRPMVAGFGLLCIAAFYGFYQLAIESGGAALASVLMYTAPAWVALMAWIFLDERMTAAKLAAVAATLTGVAAVSGIMNADSTVTLKAIIFGILSGVTYAMYYIFGKRLQPKYSTPQLFLYALPLGAIILFPFVEFHHKTPGAWIAIVTVALLSTWGAYTAYFAGLKHIEATRASVVATIEPLVAAVTAYIWWNESFTTSGYMGSLLILGAVGLIVWDGRKTNGQSEPALPQRTRKGTA